MSQYIINLHYAKTLCEFQGNWYMAELLGQIIRREYEKNI